MACKIEFNRWRVPTSLEPKLSLEMHKRIQKESLTFIHIIKGSKLRSAWASHAQHVHYKYMKILGQVFHVPVEHTGTCPIAMYQQQHWQPFVLQIMSVQLNSMHVLLTIIIWCITR